MATASVCKIDGCDKPAKTRGWCKHHYNRWWAYGSPAPDLIRQTPGSGPCGVQGCDRIGKLTRGWCDKHYQRWRKRGSVDTSLLNREQTGKPCSVEGCERPSGFKGFCQTHYQRWRATGTTDFHPKYRRRLRWIEEHAAFVGNACLVWPFGVGDQGRGVVNIAGRTISAPRAMCIQAHGEPPTPEHEAAHSCGRGHLGCINPQHLRWATHSENQADMVEHGTVVRGEKVNTAVLTEDNVRSIRRSGASTAALAQRYGVSKHCIWDVRKRRSWAWLE